MSNLSEGLKQAYARSDSYTRHLVAVEFQHAAFDQSAGYIRVVNFDSDITLPQPDGDTTYVGHAMEVREPAVGSDPDEKVRLQIDGTPGTFQFWISKAIATADPVRVDLRPFAFNMKTQSVIDIVGVYKFLVTSAEYDMSATVLSLGHVSPTNVPFPGIKYSPESHPALYR